MVAKDCNPTNVPQYRHTGGIHAKIKRRIFSDKFHPNSAAELKVRLCAVMDDMKHYAPTICSGFSGRVRALVDKSHQKGLLSVHK